MSVVYRYICGASCNYFVFAEFLCPSVASVRPGEDLYLVLWFRVFHSVKVNFICRGLTMWNCLIFQNNKPTRNGRQISKKNLNVLKTNVELQMFSASCCLSILGTGRNWSSN